MRVVEVTGMPAGGRHPSGVSAGFRWPDGIRAAATFTFDMDAEAAMLADHPETAAYLDVMAHQRYGPRTAIPRILRMLDRQGVRTTFFLPGWVAEQWPAAARSIRDAGHEIAHHGYLHESVRHLDEAAEERALTRGLEALDTVLGVRPSGYRAPSWDMNWRTPALLAKHGFRYSSNLMDSDHPYRLAVTGEAEAATLIELPVHWSLDDWEPYNYLPGLTGSGVILSPSTVLERWRLELEALVLEGGLFNLTCHPFVSGRASRVVALESLIERARSIGGLWVASCDELAAWTETLDLEPVVHRPPELPTA
jgi:peptidoglycan/xylan/chitin deacetylase (PgdA/CDA1 family)